MQMEYNEMLHPHWRVTPRGNFRSHGPFARSQNEFVYSGYETNGNDIQSLSGQTQIKGNWNTQCLGSNNAQGAEVATWVGIGGIFGP
ncbi:MAG: hypothetical protein H0W02_18555 [Ktedonobacteraceae bacterium]|nr:hypothetical protein [Ktedonobacteraceae bacterium]